MTAAAHVDTTNTDTTTTALYLKFPPFIKRKQLLDHIKKHGFGDNIVDIDMHIHLPGRKPAGSAKVLIVPSSLQDSFITSFNGSHIQDKYRVIVQPYRQHKGRQCKRTPTPTHQTPRSTIMHQAQRKTLCTTQKEPCIILVGSRLPNYLNKGHIQKHFVEFKDAITNIEFKVDKSKRGCFVLITLKSSSAAMKAIKRYNHTSLLGKHKVKVELYKPLPSSVSCPTMAESTSESTRYALTTADEKQACLPSQTCPNLAVQSYLSGTALSIKDEAHLTDKGGVIMTSRVENIDVVHPLTFPSSVVPHYSGHLATADTYESNGIPSYMARSEGDELQSSNTTVIVENLDPNVSQNDIELLLGVSVDSYTPSHMTPGNVAWIEVSDSECARTIADKLYGQLVRGRELCCSLAPSSTLRQQTCGSTLYSQHEEKWSLLHSIDFTPPGPVTQIEQVPCFFLGHDDYLESQRSQSSFTEEPSLISSVPLPVHQPQPAAVVPV